MFTPRAGRRSDRGEEEDQDPAQQHAIMANWMDGATTRPATRRGSTASSVVNRPMLGQVRKKGTFGDLAALALHGENSLRADDNAFLQRFSTGFTRAVPTSKLDSVTFNFGDRVAAWLSGMGTELRQLKEMQLDESQVQADGSRTREPSMATRLHRRSVVLIGAESTIIQRERGVGGNGEFTSLTGPMLIRKMTSMMLRAHFEAIVFGRTHGKASAAELRACIEELRLEHELSFLDRLFLRFSDSFDEMEKAELLNRLRKSPETIAAEAAAEASQTAEPIAARPRLSVSDIVAGNWADSSRAPDADDQPPPRISQTRARADSETTASEHNPSCRSRGSFVSHHI